MPPRKPSSANAAAVHNGVSKISTPKRMTRSHRARKANTPPRNASPSQDELSIEVGARDTTQVGVEEEVVLDEIVVLPATPKNAKAKDKDVDSRSQAVISGNSTEAPRSLRRSRRTSSISQAGSTAILPSGRGVPIKKQDFTIGIAADDDGKPDELSDPPTAKKRKVEPKPAQRVAVRKSRSKWDNPDEMLADSNSPLISANLRELLCNPKAWDILTPEERANILDKFPDDAEILDSGTPNARPDIVALRNNNNFRHDVARYQEGLSKGFHDPEWIRQAQTAHRSREMGHYDEFMASDFEERWEMSMPQQPRAGPEMDGNGSLQADQASGGKANDTPPIELKTMAPSEDMPGQGEETNSTAKVESANIMHRKSPGGNVQDRMDSPEDANDGKIEHVDRISEAEDVKRDRPPGSDDKQAGLPQVEVESMQNPTESGDQKINDNAHDAEAPSIPPPSAMTEGTEKQRNEEPLETNATQHADVSENAEKKASMSIQAVVTATETVEGSSKEIQEHQDGNEAPENKMVEHENGNE
ncbi:hypothetical protein F4859DRAFT_25100 [Xylaria cf. heliscus]|nr:hypothetical protein F4859DRAFT_25100 [Xylaria cf. heliscus]